MRSLVPKAVEELQSFPCGNCHGCRELRQQLKEALMQYLLSATSMHAYSPEKADIRTKRLESVLAYALTEFHEHRKDTHFAQDFARPWEMMAARNAS
ncbi:MAG: hypothetical protein ACM3JB_27580 [Acidobacteriaceae bacterium]